MTPAPASLPPLSPGYWLITTRPDAVGMAMMAIPKTTGVCITPLDAIQGRVLVPSMPVCKVEGGTWSGDVLSLRLACKGLPSESTVSGELKVAEKAISGKVEVVLQPQLQGADKGHFVYHQTGQWRAADCPAPVSRTPPEAGK